MKKSRQTPRVFLPALLLLTLIPFALTGIANTVNPADASGRWVSIVLGILRLLAVMG